MYNNAIELYTELELYEKAGDLYIKTGKRKEAFRVYEIELEKKMKRSNFYDAAQFAQHKLLSIDRAQDIYLQGWESNFHSKKCLSEYFNNLSTDEEAIENATRLSKGIDDNNKKYDFVDVLANQIRTREKNDELKDIAYEFVAQELENNYRFMDQIQLLEPKNTEIKKDTFRYKLGRNQGKNKPGSLKNKH